MTKSDLMQIESRKLPSNFEIHLYYCVNHDPGDYAHKCVDLCVLQTRKSGHATSKSIEAYEKEKGALATTFATELVARCKDVGIIVVPPSSTRQFDPYLEALKKLDPGIRVVDHAFGKSDDFRVGDKNTTLEQVQANIRAVALPQVDEMFAGTICILDDIFADGRTAALIIELIQPCFPNARRFIVACPLKVTNTPIQKTW
jgi:hypothetical protein